MINKKIQYTLALTSIFVAGCMGHGHKYNQNNNWEQRGATTQQTSKHISNETKQSIAYMYDEERLAKEVYLSIYQKQPVRQLSKIASKAETRHIDAVKNLAQRYGIPTPTQKVGKYQHKQIESLYNKLYTKGIRSQKDALEVGCIVEVTDIDDLDKFITQAQKDNAQDIVQIYDFLRNGSYNHYWAFDKGLKQLGVSNGCCSLGDEYCHMEYPKNKHGNGNGGRWR